MANPSPVLTIALSVHNGGPDLALAIQSLISQSFKDWELLLIDDASTDDAIAGLSQLSDSRIQLFRHEENKGLAERLNEAVITARGVYFARMDQDDISHPDRLALQLSFLQEHPNVDLLGTRCVKMDERENILGALRAAILHEDICAQPWRGFYLAHPTWMGRTKWFRHNLYANPGPYCCEDQELLLRASIDSRYHTLEDYLLAYRVRTRTSLAKLAKTRLAWFKVQSAHFLRNGAYLSLVLAGLSCALRICSDIARTALQWRSKGTDDYLDTDQEVFWQSYIQSLKLEVDNDLS
jgi:glycosyltransferase involved in cell wall biosynthesis